MELSPLTVGSIWRILFVLICLVILIYYIIKHDDDDDDDGEYVGKPPNWIMWLRGNAREYEI